jgi:hypothetical protein
MALPSKPLTIEGWGLALVIIWLFAFFSFGMNFQNSRNRAIIGMDYTELYQKIKECEAELPRNQKCIGTVTVQVADNVESSR